MRMLVLLALAVALCASCADEPAPDTTPAGPAWLTHRPKNAHPYADETLARFGKLVESDGWRDAAWNAQGTLEVQHERTGLVFVLVPDGKFRMGSDDRAQAEKYASGLEQEKPVHEVAVHAFLLSRTECQKSAWEKVGTSEPLFTATDDPMPAVDGLFRDECQEWCRRAGLRLPTEKEWEYACRAGSTGRWCFGDDESLLRDYAWYRDNLDAEAMFVGLKRPNAWGFFDMHGNAGEWCSDDFHLYPGSPPIQRAPDLPQFPVWRGGHSGSPAWFTRSAFRDGEHPRHKFGKHGFRPAADLPE
jgi:formylglycine-generating enzyme required for sulfatase activity